jgi:hypothetical protein
MTGFDNQLRSQEYGQRSAMFYDQQKYRAMEGTGQAAQQTFGQIPELLAMQRELQMREMESAQRHTVQQTELQIAQQKLQHAQVLDIVELSRQQTRNATLQNDMMELQVKEGRRAAESAGRNELREMNIALARANAQAGDYLFEFDPRKADTSEAFRKRTDDEMKAAVERERESRSRIGNNGVSEFNAQRNYYAQLLRDIGDPGSENFDADLARSVRKKLVDLDPSLKGGDEPKKETKPAQDDPRIGETARMLRTIGSAPGMGYGGEHARFALPGAKEAQEKVASYLWQNADRLVAKQQQGFDRDPARRGMKATPETAVQALVDILNGGEGDPRRDAVMQMLRAAGVVQ